MFLKKIYLIFLISFINLPLAISSENVVFIDIDYVLNNSNFGKNIYNDLNDLNEKNLNYLSEKEKLIKEKKLSIEKMKNISSKKKFESDVELFNDEVVKYKIEKDKILNDFIKKKDEKLNNFLIKINPLIEEYMRENSIDLILEKNQIFIGNTNKDISDEILKIVNNKI
ncbi:OmpH family outer membrane protein [Candidatus Pelagibacter sp. HIMB1506]|uniref:OmpH family outer membrane protein n=1 Tax=Candidatus Pelagibacter sp. HIMB1506 TaxID=3413337 RepID=UPI003F86AFBD